MPAFSIRVPITHQSLSLGRGWGSSRDKAGLIAALMELMVRWVELRRWGQWPFGEGLTWWEPSGAELAALTMKPVLSAPGLGRRGSTSCLRVAGMFWQALPLEGVRSGRQMVTFILATSTRVLGGPERPSPALRVVVSMFPPKALALGAALRPAPFPAGASSSLWPFN